MNLENKKKDKIENVKETKKEFQRVFQNSSKIKKGHKLFEYNLDTLELKEVVYDKKPEILWEDSKKGLISTRKEVTKKENCIYISALNKKNALKKISYENKRPTTAN